MTKSVEDMTKVISHFVTCSSCSIRRSCRIVDFDCQRAVRKWLGKEAISNSETSGRSTRLMMDLCIKYDWFTGGTNEQYEKLMEKVVDGTDCHTLATLIWMCSHNVELDDVAAILTENGF